MKNTLLLTLLVIALFACQKSEFSERHDLNELPSNYAIEFYLNLPETPASYERILPNYLKAAGMTPVPVSNQKATLGRVLFYDSNLSQDRTIACASCHNQKKAFSDTEAFSTGIKGLKSARNSMPLANVASFSAHYNPLDGAIPLLLWDNRAASVAQQSTMAFLNDHEMGMTMDEVVARVREQPYYDLLWQKTFGHFNVEATQILDCLTEFVGAMGAANSKFDKALEQVNGNINFEQTVLTVHQIYAGSTDTTVETVGLPGFNEWENRGRFLFIDNCSKCHSPIRPFQEVTEACNGLELEYADQGKGALTGIAADNGVFKAPSLRNISLTAPYMHDGRFKTLLEVIEFYSTGVQNHPNLHPAMLKNGSALRNFTPQEKGDLQAFLLTLTDGSIGTDTRFNNPFWY